MSEPTVSTPPPAGPPPGGAPTGGRALPDVNAQITPYDIVQHLLDQTASFNLFAVPESGYAETATLTPHDRQDWFGLNGGYGIALRSALHHFAAVVQPPSAERGVAVAQSVGSAAGSFEARCFFAPPDFPWSPQTLPPPVIFDPWRPQRFVVHEGEIVFGAGQSCRVYGVGRTYPITVDGRPRLLVGGVGNLMDGRGRFAGLEGTFVLTGRLTGLGFLGNLTFRVVDPEGRLRTDRELPAPSAIADPDPDDSFLVFRGVKKNRHVKTVYGPPPDARRVSLITPSEMRSVDLRFVTRDGDGPLTNMQVGPVAGPMEANVFFDLLAPPGTALAPVPFTTQELYTFIDGSGATVGTLTAGIVEGISFALRFPAAPGQPGVRFAGFGPITGGTGAFAGARGLLTVNSLIGISPHALTLLHVLHLVDPEGRFRAGGRRCAW